MKLPKGLLLPVFKIRDSNVLQFTGYSTYAATEIVLGLVVSSSLSTICIKVGKGIRVGENKYFLHFTLV